MVRPRRPLRVRSAAAAAGMFGFALLVAAGGGCELAIGDAIPAFACNPGPDACPDNEVCDPVRHQCVPACTVASCPDGMQCSGVSRLCMMVTDASGGGTDGPDGADSAGMPDAGPAEASADVVNDTASGADTQSEAHNADSGCRGLLCACAGDSACDSHVCAGELNVGPGLYGAAGNANFCTMPCCTSADCDPSLVCYAATSSTTTGNYCVPPGWLQRLSALGASIGGDSCNTNANCRSGLCAGGTCADTCCSTSQATTDCGSGTTCGFGAFPGIATFDQNFAPNCSQGGTGRNGDNCSTASDCASGLCVSLGPLPSSCEDVCRSSTDCSGSGFSCSYGRFRSQNSNTGVYAVCGQAQGGNGADGTACQHNSDCQSGFCDSTAGLCSDVCFSEADCSPAPPSVSAWHCRPEQITLQNGGGAASVLCCGP